MNIYRCYSSAFVLFGHQFPVQLDASHTCSPCKCPVYLFLLVLTLRDAFSLFLHKFDELVMSNNQAPHHSAQPVFKMLLHLFSETKMCMRNSHLNAAGLTKRYIYPEKTRKMGGSKGNTSTPMKK